MQVETNDVAEFFDEARVLRLLESIHAVRLQSVLVPDAPDHRFADSRRFGHRARRPVRRVGRLRAQRHLHDHGDSLGRQRLAAGWTRRIAQHASDPQGQVSLCAHSRIRIRLRSSVCATCAGLTRLTSINTIRARSAVFCGVRPLATNVSSCARSAGEATKQYAGWNMPNRTRTRVRCTAIHVHNRRTRDTSIPCSQRSSASP